MANFFDPIVADQSLARPVYVPPVEQPKQSMLGSLLANIPGRGVMTDVGGTMRDIAPALAMAGKAILAAGGTQGTPANAISDIASTMAAGSKVPQVAGTVPNQPTRIQQMNGAGGASTTAGGQQFNDVNKNGIMDPGEEISIKASGSSAIANLGKMLSGMGGANFSESAEGNVGSTAPNTNAPYIRNSYEAGDQATMDDAALLAGLTGDVKSVSDLIKFRATQPIAQMQAQADMMKARTGQLNAQLAMDKQLFERSPEYIKLLEMQKFAEKRGEVEGKEKAREQIIAKADTMPLKDEMLNALGYKTHGDLMRATGADDVSTSINAAMSAKASLQAAYLRLQGTREAAGMNADALLKSAALGLLTQNNAAIGKLQGVEVPLPLDDPGQPAQQTRFLLKQAKPGTAQDVQLLKELNAQNELLRKNLGGLSGIPNNSETPAVPPQQPKSDIMTKKVGDKVQTNVGELTIIAPGVGQDAKGKKYKLQ